ncbi:MAG: GNAT family N-acetyltransferase [Clostridia bacterium]|nr:GNAT family N-acetyltransferase [Clostridia bacterium]
MISFHRIDPSDDTALAALIRHSLKAHNLDLPGTAYYDAGLDHLSQFYTAAPDKRAYFVLRADGETAGGVGLSEFPFLPCCAELQKLYLEDRLKGQGLGYRMIALAEEEAKRLGYTQMYLETHTNLQAALHIYEKSGYRQIPRPDFVQHSTMNRFFFKKLT